MTPLGTLIRSARESATPTLAELGERAGRGGGQVKQGISAAELADRINASRAPHETRIAPSHIYRAEGAGDGPRGPMLAAICDALGLDVELVPVKERV